MYCPEEIEGVLLTEEKIKAKVSELGELLTREYAEKNPLFICVLKGSVVFFADLIREINCPLEIAFCVHPVMAAELCQAETFSFPSVRI